jgi:GntR family transcriptional regulator/MocR family aminotransferase
VPAGTRRATGTAAAAARIRQPVVSSLPLELDRSAHEPLYRQIERQIRAGIEAGTLAAGVRLPGVRTLAEQLGVARITVVGAYDQLAAEGFLVGRVGLGTVVAAASPSLPAALPATVPTAVPSGIGRLPGTPGAQMPASRQERAGQPGAPVSGRRQVRFDFRPGAVDRQLMDDGAWQRRLADAGRETARSPSRGSERGDHLGDPDLRELLAAYLGGSRAVRATAESIVVLPNRRSVYALLGRVLAGPQRVCAVEDPADPSVAQAFAASGALIRRVPVDGQRLCTELLPADGCLVAVTPAWQFPQGGTLPIERRRALLDWAERRGAVIVEDDRDGDLRYAGTVPPALQALDRTGRVVHVGSFGRLCWPGLALGYAVLPDWLVGEVRDRLGAEGLEASRLEQRALAGVIADGQLDRQERRLRKALVQRQAALLAAIGSEAADLLAAAPAPAGRHLVATIRPSAWDASRLSFRAREAGVAITPLSRYRSAPGPDRRLLLGYAGHPPEMLAEGIAQLRHVARLADRPSGPVRLVASGRRPAAAP